MKIGTGYKAKLDSPFHFAEAERSKGAQRGKQRSSACGIYLTGNRPIRSTSLF